MTGTATALQASLIIDPGPDEPLFALHRARPGTRQQDLPRFGHPRWDLGLLNHTEAPIRHTVDWALVPERFCPAIKRAGWAVLNLPTPQVIRERHSSSRLVPSASTVRHAIRGWQRFTQWLDDHGIRTLSQVTEEHLEQFAAAERCVGRTWAADGRTLSDLSRLWGFAPYLPPQDRLAMPPWERPDSTISDFLGTADSGPGGENTTAVIHPSVISPLLVWSLRMVLDFAPDILAACQAARRMRERIPRRGSRDGITKAQAHLRGMIERGEPIPTSLRPSIQRLVQLQGPRQRGLAITTLAGTIGVTRRQVVTAATTLGTQLRDEHLGRGAPLGTAITGRIGDAPWTGPIDDCEVDSLVIHLSTAVLITVSYLSGMRPDEVLHLERGCCTRREQPDGTVRHLITGRHFKDAVDEQGNHLPGGEIRHDPWIVIELVHKAIAIQEALAEPYGRFLFPRQLSKAAKLSKQQGAVITRATTKENIARFIDWANEQAVRHGRTHEAIPQDPEGALTLRRFRRTVAWFIYRQPGGRIALGVQYGHVGTAMGESYAGRSKTDMLQILDFERGLAMAETLADAAQRLHAGEGVSGPAAARYIRAATEYGQRYAGAFTTSRGLKALRGNPRLQIFEDPRAMLTCNYDPFTALCHDERIARTAASHTPDRTNCDPACPNVSRTDTQIDHHRREIERIDAELAAGLAPQPLAQRQRQRKTKLLQIVAKHEVERIRPSLKHAGA